MRFKAISLALCLVASDDALGQTAAQTEAIRQVQNAISLSSYCQTMQIDDAFAKSYLHWFGLRLEDITYQGRYHDQVKLFATEVQEVLSKLSPDSACTLAEMLYGPHGRNIVGLMIAVPTADLGVMPAM